ncbi:peptidoglycan-binding protein [Gemmatimonas sp.]|uniref:peptidoglycan-binding domain-containing protein n=1 Tax=Gemmatimonas sp. TaxID=1962908 RepID=UPI003566C328
MAVAGVVVAVIEGGSNEMSAEPVTSISVEAPEAALALTTTSEVATTTTLSEEDLFAAASASWGLAIDRGPASVASSSVGIIAAKLTAATLDRDTGLVSIWAADGNGTWIESDEWLVEGWSPGMSGIENMAMVDLTNDGSTELFLEYSSGNGFVGRVYQQGTPGWTSIGFGELLRLQEDGTLLGTTEVCLPSCAAGFGVPYSYLWDGSRFVTQAVDSFGNPITVFVETTCPSYRFVVYAPLSRCAKGDAVQQLQFALDAAGSLFYTDYGRQATDGYFGAGTETSVRLYQFRNGLPVTGVAEGQWYYNLIEDYNYLRGTGYDF